MRDLDSTLKDLAKVNNGISRCFVKVKPGETVTWTNLNGNKTMRQVGADVGVLEVTQEVHNLRGRR